MNSVAHFYHCYVMNDWKRITDEHIDALISSGLSERMGTLKLGVVGSPNDRHDAISYIASRLPTEVVAEADQGFEQVTLAAIKQNPRGDFILYCHTKGTHGPGQDLFRQAMTKGVVEEWRKCVEYLTEYEMGATFVMTEDHYPPGYSGPKMGPMPFFLGNFWWITAGAIANLPEPTMNNRYWAETWATCRPPNKIFSIAPLYELDGGRSITEYLAAT